MYDIVITSAVLAVSLAAFELIARVTHLTPATARKMVHVGMAVCIAILSLHVPYRLFAVMGTVFFGVLALLRRKQLLRSLSYQAHTSYGELFFPLGISTAAILAGDTRIFVTTVMVLGLADTAAFFAGKILPKPGLYRGKTVAGSLACCATTVLLCAIAGYGWVVVGVAGVVVAMIELISPYGSDNLTIPLACALLLGVLV